MLPGMYEDLRDNAFHLRHDDGGIARFEGRNIFGGVVHFRGLGSLDLHRHGLRSARLCAFVSAAGGSQQKEDAQE